MTLALLLTAVTGAWAEDTYTVTFKANGNTKTVENVTLPKKFSCNYKNGLGTDELDLIIQELYGLSGGCCDTNAPNSDNASVTCDIDDAYNQYIIVSAPFNGTATVTGRYIYPNKTGFNYILKINCADPNTIDVEWNAATKTGTFSMPGSDVVLTPIYSEATVLSYDESETAYASLKEAFANLQDGDCIKLDWNVTLTEQLETPTIADGADFTIDFNGYTISGDYGIYLNNVGDRLMFTDSSIGVMGGYQAGDLLGTDGSVFAFDAGRFKLGSSAAATLNEYCAVPENPWELLGGKEFTDLEGGAAANDGFTLLVDYKAIELTIGAGKFATFYGDYNTKFADGTDDNIDFYIISSVDDAHTTATVAQYNSDVVPGSFPVLVYNGTGDQQTVKLVATDDPLTIPAQMQSGAFQGTATDKTFTETDMAAKDYYVLSGGSAFAPVKGKGTIAAHKCWLEFAKNNGNARSFKIVFDNGDATGVNEVIEVNEVSDDTLYDLNGRKLNAKPTRKGVYIQNGQKVVK